MIFNSKFEVVCYSFQWWQKNSVNYQAWTTQSTTKFKLLGVLEDSVAGEELYSFIHENSSCSDRSAHFHLASIQGWWHTNKYLFQFVDYPFSGLYDGYILTALDQLKGICLSIRDYHPGVPKPLGDHKSCLWHQQQKTALPFHCLVILVCSGLDIINSYRLYIIYNYIIQV